METAGGSEPRVLWVINVFDRLYDLRAQLRLLRHHFGRRIDLHVYCSGPSYESGWGEDRHVVHHTTARQDGFRDALRYTAMHGPPYDLVVSTQAKTWCTNYSVLDDLLRDIWRRGDKVAVLDPGSDGCMRDDRFDSMYCDLIIVRGGLSGLLYHPGTMQGEFPEREAYHRIHETVRFPRHIRHSGGRHLVADSGEFRFTDLEGTEHSLLCGYSDRPGKWDDLRRLNPAYADLVEDIRIEQAATGSST